MTDGIFNYGNPAISSYVIDASGYYVAVNVEDILTEIYEALTTNAPAWDLYVNSLRSAGNLQVDGNNILDSSGATVVSFDGAGDIDQLGSVVPVDGEVLTWVAANSRWEPMPSSPDWEESVKDKDLNTPPVGPAAGDRYIVAAGGVGAWAGHDDDIAEWDGANWIFTAPTTGTATYVEDESVMYIWNGANWVKMSSVFDHGTLLGLADDDHTQYLLVDGTRAMTGNFDMGTFAIINVGNVDGVDVSAIVAFKTITGITNDVVADSLTDTLTLSSANAILTIVGTTATDTILFTIDQSQIDHGSIAGLGDNDHVQYINAIAGAPLTLAAQTITFNYDVTDFQLNGNDLQVKDSGIDHDATTNFVADKHIAHSGVSISGGTGLTGGGDITVSRTISLSHLGLESLTDPGADRVMFWDESANALEWLTVSTGLDITDTTLTCTITQYTDVMVENVIVADLVDGQSIDNAIDALIATHTAIADAHHTKYALTDDLAAGEISQIQNIDAVTISNAQWGYLGALDQGLTTGSSPTFAGMTVVNAITEFSTDGTLGGNSDSALPTEKAVKTYVDAAVVGAGTLATVLVAGNESDGTNLLLDEGSDLIIYSDDKITEVARIDGATGNITTSGTVDGVDIAGLKADVDGFPDELKNLVQAEIQQLENIGATTISAAQWGYLGALDQGLTTGSSPTFAGMTVVNAITEFSTDGTLGGNSDSALPTEKAVKSYADSLVSTTSPTYPRWGNIGVGNGASISVWYSGYSIVVLPSADNNATLYCTIRIPDNWSGTTGNLKILYGVSVALQTYSGVWVAGSFAAGEIISTPNVLNASTAYDFSAQTNTNRFYEKTIPLTNLAAGDLLAIRFYSDASNSTDVYISDVWLEP